MKNQLILINWFGPYDLDEIDKIDNKNGLYLLGGKQKFQREAEIQYCGITEGKIRNRLNAHHKLPLIYKELAIWFGQIIAPEEHTRSELECTESIIIYLWQPALNERKRVKPPKPITVVSHWFKKNGDYRKNQHRLYKDIPDVISWDGTLWRTGNLSVYGDE